MPKNELDARVGALVTKVEARLAEVCREAAEAFAAVAAEAPLDAAPANGIVGALTARIDGIAERLDAACEEVEDERALDRIAALRRRVDEAGEDARIDGLAVVGRALRALAESEDPTQRCPRCGGPFDPGPVVRSTHVRCPHCGSVCSVGPGPARTEWLARGTPALADLEAHPAWRAWQEAERAFHAFDHPTIPDLERFADAHDAWQRTRLAALVRLHPGWTEAQAEVERKAHRTQLLGHFAAARVTMETLGEGLAVAARGDAGRIRRWAATKASTPDTRSILLSEVLEAAAERGLRKAAAALVEVVHADEMPRWFGRAAFVRARLRELSLSC